MGSESISKSVADAETHNTRDRSNNHNTHNMISESKLLKRLRRTLYTQNSRRESDYLQTLESQSQFE